MLAMPEPRDDGHGVVDQHVDHVVGMLCRVRPCIECVAALIRGGRKIAGLGKRNRLRFPVMAGDAEAVQHQYQRSAGIAGDRDVEFHPRRCPHDACLDRRSHRRFLALPKSSRANLDQKPLRSHPAAVRGAQ